MKQWEYKRIQTTANSVKSIDEIINQLGFEGWELVTSFVPNSNSVVFSYVHLIFKREV